MNNQHNLFRRDFIARAALASSAVALWRGGAAQDSAKQPARAQAVAGRGVKRSFGIPRNVFGEILALAGGFR
ncbi:MAG: hypothetical protein NTY01_20205 [Verrucomicrobia bacterium]|nr:hypothetical protein [Verrucomicrobiota bacterium]